MDAEILALQTDFQRFNNKSIDLKIYILNIKNSKITFKYFGYSILVDLYMII